MDRHDRLSDQQIRLLTEIADGLRLISDTINSAQFALQMAVLEGHVSDGPHLTKARKVLDGVQDAVSGQAYMFTPQPEWLGGPAHLKSNTCYRWPHIIRDQI